MNRDTAPLSSSHNHKALCVEECVMPTLTTSLLVTATHQPAPCCLCIVTFLNQATCPSWAGLGWGGQ